MIFTEAHNIFEKTVSVETQLAWTERDKEGTK